MTKQKHVLGDAPIEERHRKRMNELATLLDVFFNGDLRGKHRPTGFVLMVFPFGDVESGRCNFISNGADRKDVATLMREMIARFEGMPETKGTV
jgi:hypothetical protein